MSETPLAPLRAALGMYDFPWTAPANDMLWQAIAARLGAAGLSAPEELTREIDPHDLSASGRMAFGQTCGYPFITELYRHAALVATPIYDFPGCVGAAHCSFLVAHEANARQELADFRGARAVINARDSNTGMNLFRAMIAPLAGGKAFFGEVEISGSHAASLDAVAAKRADLAAIDCVSLGLIERGRPELADKVRVVARSPMSPGLPFIISNALAPTYLAALRVALVDTLADPRLASARKTLGLVGAQILQVADYETVAQFERDAIGAGYPVLA